MGKREDRRYGGRLAVLTFVLLCLQGTGGQAYAQEDKAGERRIRYSSSYLKEAEIPEAPEEYLEEGKITYRLGLFFLFREKTNTISADLSST